MIRDYITLLGTYYIYGCVDCTRNKTQTNRDPNKLTCVKLYHSLNNLFYQARVNDKCI